MSKSIVQPVGQKRLTNVAFVRLKKHGIRFEIACFKNKVLSWRSGVEKDLNEVLQSHIVYSNVSKGVLAKSKDLISAFGIADQTKICLEILEKGELQVSGKERESLLSSQFRDIATIVMQKTINPETRCPYPVSMIERLMRDIHFAVDPISNSKKQALDVIRELQKHFPIKRCPMRLRLSVPRKNAACLMERLVSWDAAIVSEDEAGSDLCVVCETEPSFFKECEGMARKLSGRLEVVAISSMEEGDMDVDAFKVAGDDGVPRVSKSPAKSGSGAAREGKEKRCTTCDAAVGDDVGEFRQHFRSEWHRHNLMRKTKNLPPLPPHQCVADLDLRDPNPHHLIEYS